MSEQLNYLLIKAYHHWKSMENSPVPISLIKDYLLLEGIDPDEEHISKNRNGGDKFEEKNKNSES